MSLETLAIRHYELRQEQIRLRELRAVELSKCEFNIVTCASDFLQEPDRTVKNERLSIIADFTSRKPTYMDNCYSMIFDGLKEQDEYYGFDEALFNYGCEHCNKARDLKREIGAIGTKIGQIRGQITRYGKRLLEAKK